MKLVEWPLIHLERSEGVLKTVLETEVLKESVPFPQLPVLGPQGLVRLEEFEEAGPHI